MIAAAVIAGLAALIGAFWAGYHFGHGAAMSGVITAAVLDEQRQALAAVAARAKIEAAGKAALAKIPTETSAELGAELWGDNDRASKR